MYRTSKRNVNILFKKDFKCIELLTKTSFFLSFTDFRDRSKVYMQEELNVYHCTKNEVLH